MRCEWTLSCGIVRFTHPKQVLTGKTPSHGMIEIAENHLLSSGSRPPPPDHCEVSSIVWQIVQSCWDPSAQRQMSAEEVVALLEGEQRRIALLES